MQENAILHLRCSKLREESVTAEGAVLELASKVRSLEACLKVFDRSTALSRLAEALLELKVLRSKVVSQVWPHAKRALSSPRSAAKCSNAMEACRVPPPSQMHWYFERVTHKMWLLSTS
jgi:hypothetical protein